MTAPSRPTLINHCYQGDCRNVMRQLIDDGVKVQCIVTSPPYYGLRDYGVPGQLGMEKSPDEYISNMVDVFRTARDLLADDGVLWLNIGDSYAGSGKGRNSDGTPATKSEMQKSSAGTIYGHLEKADLSGFKPKDLIGTPWMLAFALRADGWFLRQDIIWHKPNPMPESVTDRCTKAHEYIFLLSKSPRYFYDIDAIKEPAKEWTGRAATFDRSGNMVADHVIPGQTAAQHRPRPSVQRGGFNGKTGDKAFRAVIPTRNKRSVWTVATTAYDGAHFAVFPPELIEPCILAGSRVGDIVFDPFMGSGTVAQVAQNLGRRWLGAELNPDYIKLQAKRTRQLGLMLGGGQCG